MVSSRFSAQTSVDQGNKTHTQQLKPLYNIIISPDLGSGISSTLGENGLKNCVYYNSIDSFNINEKYKKASNIISTITLHTQSLEDGYRGIKAIEENIGKTHIILLVDDLNENESFTKPPSVQSIFRTKDHNNYLYQAISLSNHLTRSELATIQLKRDLQEERNIYDSIRNKLSVHNMPIEAINSSELKIYNIILNSLENNLFTLAYQPIVNLNSNKITHYEVLLRMSDPADNSAISPSLFIPIAERYNMIGDIDKWVIKRTFYEISASEHNNIKYEINLSAQYFDDDGAAQYIDSLMEQYDIKGKNIIFEITETSSIVNFNQTKNEINKIKALGVKIALDDFGTGYNSFAQLRKLPIDFIKIDGSYIIGIDNNSHNQAFVTAIVTLAHSTNKKVIAECVENQASLDTLRELNIDYAQGYFIGMPEILADALSFNNT